jgi:hypothetical protein
LKAKIMFARSGSLKDQNSLLAGKGLLTPIQKSFLRTAAVRVRRAGVEDRVMPRR